MRRVVVPIVLLCGLLLGGCHRVLLPKNAPRTQFETYDTMRNRFIPLEEPDVFGHPRPALRERLSEGN